MRQSLICTTIRATMIRISILISLVWGTSTFSPAPASATAVLANPTSTAQNTLSELKGLVEKTKLELKRHLPLERKIASLQKLRSFVSDQLHRQGDLADNLVKKPDPNEDVLALELIGLDQDLSGFMDDMEPVPFHPDRCDAYQHNLVHGYANSDSDNPPLPSHAQDTLIFLQLLCRSK